MFEYHFNKQTTASTADSEWKKHWLHQSIQEISQRDGLNYVYNEKALTTLLENDYSPPTIRTALDEAARFVKLMGPDNNGEHIIQDYHLKFTYVNFIETTHPNKLTPRMDKSYQLLDRLENAVQKVIDSGLSPTSKQVGMAMDHPITAPAIRDALKKNRQRVLQLFTQYPDKWPAIRQYFRPITNLYPKDSAAEKAAM